MTAKTVNTPCSAHVCPHKMAFMLDNWVRKRIQNPNRILGEYIRAGDTVVDIGCGPGFFTTEMARMVGEHGRVVAVDLQEGMLGLVRKKAAAHHLSQSIEYHLCKEDGIGLHLDQGADFILAYWMVHELPDPAAFFREVKSLLKKGGRCLVVEPLFHVTKSAFQKMILTAEEAGFTAVARPRKKGGRSVVLTLCSN